MKTSKAGIDLIKEFESLHDGDLSKIGLQPKLCPAGYWTEGYGHVIMQFGKPLKGTDNKKLAYSLSKIKTEKEALEILAIDLEARETAVLRIVKVPLNQFQFDALVSFIYNVGEGNFLVSTLLKRLNAMDYNSAAENFKYWNKAGGKVLPGLIKRREAEKKLFLSIHTSAPFLDLKPEHAKPKPLQQLPIKK